MRLLTSVDSVYVDMEMPDTPDVAQDKTEIKAAITHAFAQLVEMGCSESTFPPVILKTLEENGVPAVILNRLMEYIIKIF